LNKILVFHLDKIFFGVNIEEIKSLSKLGRTKKIPKSPEWVGGVTKYRTGAFPLVKLWEILKLQVPKKKILLLPTTLDYCAFLISGVKGIYELNINKESSKIYNLPYLCGLGTFQDKTLLLIELDNLLSSRQKNILKKITKKNDKR
jgi:chemotaxis signal transduction protein